MGWLAILVMMYATNHFDVFGLMLWVVVLPIRYYWYYSTFLLSDSFLPKKGFGRGGIFKFDTDDTGLGFIASLITDLICKTNLNSFHVFMLLLYSVFIAAPFSWYVYKTIMIKFFYCRSLVFSGKPGFITFTNQSSFLFNTLNSLYGTVCRKMWANQWGDSKTLETWCGLCFYENTQDSISLSREIITLKPHWTAKLRNCKIARYINRGWNRWNLFRFANKRLCCWFLCWKRI